MDTNAKVLKLLCIAEKHRKDMQKVLQLTSLFQLNFILVNVRIEKTPYIKTLEKSILTVSPKHFKNLITDKELPILRTTLLLPKQLKQHYPTVTNSRPLWASHRPFLLFSPFLPSIFPPHFS